MKQNPAALRHTAERYSAAAFSLDTILGRTSPLFYQNPLPLVLSFLYLVFKNGEILIFFLTKPTWYSYEENLLWKKMPYGIPKQKHIDAASDQTSLWIPGCQALKLYPTATSFS